MDIHQNAAEIQRQIQEACKRKNRKPEDVKVIAVTKYVSATTAQEAVNAGIFHIGENRPEGLLEKKEQLTGHVKWHFIGTLQSRKVKEVLPYADYIHSLDRLSLAKEIQKRADRLICCFIQVNISEEESKHGIPLKDLMVFVDKLKEYDKIQVIGLMTMAPDTEDKEWIRSIFRKMKELQKAIQDKQLSYAPCQELSMGMSNDYIIAVEEGATFIRIGTSLVGKEY